MVITLLVGMATRQERKSGNLLCGKRVLLTLPELDRHEICDRDTWQISSSPNLSCYGASMSSTAAMSWESCVLD